MNKELTWKEESCYEIAEGSGSFIYKAYKDVAVLFRKDTFFKMHDVGFSTKITSIEWAKRVCQSFDISISQIVEEKDKEIKELQDKISNLEKRIKNHEED